MMKFKSAFEQVKYDAMDYIGLYKTPASDLGRILASIAASEGARAFSDPAVLMEKLSAAGASQVDIHSIGIMTQVKGYGELIKCDARTVQADLDRYIKNAARVTGFNRDRILYLTGSIAYALGIEMSDERAGKGPKVTTDKVVEALSSAVYRDELERFTDDFNKVVADGDASVRLDFAGLEPFANLGIPEAQYYLGYCFFYGVQLEEDKKRGIALMESAAAAGNSRAAATLGDYYYERGTDEFNWFKEDNWVKAYNYYTGYGAIALNDDRKAAIACILNRKLYNRKLLGLCVILFCVLTATVIWPLATTTFAARAFWGWAAVVIQLALLVLGILRCRARPYAFLDALPVVMTGVWFVYMAIRLLF